MDDTSFRKHAHELVDWIADFLENIEDYPVMPNTKPGEIIAKLPNTPPTEPEPVEEVLQSFQETILSGITHWQHPSFFAYFPANSSPPSLLAEFLTAALGAQCMGWQTSPAATELEEQVMEWLRQMLGLPTDFMGVIQDTASTATLGALICAREKASDFNINLKGYKSDKTPPMTVYTSAESHSSIEKGAKIAGFGKEMVRKIKTDEKFAMSPDELEKSIKNDINKGIVPAAVVAATGTTSSLAIDPLEKIGQICKKFNIWLHVDAAMAGTAALLPEKRWILEGIEYADSFVFNPHKWMFTNFDCSAYFCKDPKHLIKTFTIDPEYLKTDVDLKVKNYRDWGIPLGRRFRALKLWFVIRMYGVEGLQEKIRNHIKIAGKFACWVNSDENFELLAPVDLNLVCFRFKPKKMSHSDDDIDKLNKEIMDRANETGKLFLTHTKLNGKFTLRMSIGATRTELKHLQEAWNIIKEISSKL